MAVFRLEPGRRSCKSRTIEVYKVTKLSLREVINSAGGPRARDVNAGDEPGDDVGDGVKDKYSETSRETVKNGMVRVLLENDL